MPSEEEWIEIDAMVEQMASTIVVWVMRQKDMIIENKMSFEDLDDYIMGLHMYNKMCDKYLARFPTATARMFHDGMNNQMYSALDAETYYDEDVDYEVIDYLGLRSWSE